jgi:O-methyltransferase
LTQINYFMATFRTNFKWLYYSLKLHNFTPQKTFGFLSQIAKTSKWIQKHKDIDFTNFPTKKFDYNKRYDLYSYVIEKENLNTNIDYFEFGVFQGKSFKWWMQQIKDEEARFYGFDTFTGLPEDWGPFKKGDLANNNTIPEISDNRHKFFQGLFQQTLPEFLKNYDNSCRKVILMDADLYSSTAFVLQSLSTFLKPGDILLFDEFNVPEHEFKAFTEWVDTNYVKYEVLGEVNNFYQVAIKIGYRG